MILNLPCSLPTQKILHVITEIGWYVPQMDFAIPPFKCENEWRRYDAGHTSRLIKCQAKISFFVQFDIIRASHDSPTISSLYTTLALYTNWYNSANDS